MVQGDLENATRKAHSSAGDHFGWNMGSPKSTVKKSKKPRCA